MFFYKKLIGPVCVMLVFMLFTGSISIAGAFSPLPKAYLNNGMHEYITDINNSNSGEINSLHTEYVTEEGFLYGDVNGNGQIDVGDAILVLRHIVNLINIEKDYGQDALAKAKVSGSDGDIAVADAILILRFIVGLIDKFPIVPVFPEGPVIESLEPSSGYLGSVATVRGQNFGEGGNGPEVFFAGEEHGTMQAGILSASDTEIEVLVPGVSAEQLTVYVVCGDQNSNTGSFEFLGIPRADAGDNLPAATLDSVTALLEATKHEIQIGLTPSLDSDLAEEILNVLDEMIDEIGQSIDELLQDRSPEELMLINDILSSPAVQEQLQAINEAADILSRSSVSEALGNIVKAKEMLTEVKNVLDSVAYVFTVARNTAAAMSLAALALGEISTATILGDVASTLTSILNNVINPARFIVTGILSILDMSPTKAVEDSLEFYAYQNDLGIDQYFQSLRVVYSARWSDLKGFFEARVNRLVSVASLIKDDLHRLSDPERVGEEAAARIGAIVNSRELPQKAAEAALIAGDLRENGAIHGYENPRETMAALKEYAEIMSELDTGIKEVRKSAARSAEGYTDDLLRYSYPPEIFRMFSLGRKMQIINTGENYEDNSKAIKANEHYRVYIAAEILLGRVLGDLQFDFFNLFSIYEDDFNKIYFDLYPYFDDFTVEFFEKGTISAEVFFLIWRVLQITPEEIADLKEGITDWKDAPDDLGAIIVAQPYFFRGRVDFTSRDNSFLSVENILGGVGSGLDDLISMSNPITSLISRLVMNFVDEKIQEMLTINLVGVPVPLQVTFLDDDGTERSTSEIIEWQWVKGTQTVEGVSVTDKLMLKAKQPGEETVMITAVLAEEDEDFAAEGKEAFSVVRKIKTVSGYQTDSPYNMGPEMDSIVNLSSLEEGHDGEDYSGYIGDILRIEGFGFSKKAGVNQSVFFGEAGLYNETGMAPRWLQAENEYTEFQVEIPDALTGPVIVSVGPDGGSREKWPGNPLEFTINDPRIDYTNPSAIIGEAWPVWGRGFSHTAAHNKGIWSTGDLYSDVIKPPPATAPMEPHGSYASEVTGPNHGDHHHLHRRLDFVVPPDAADGEFSVNTIGELNTLPSPVTVREFSANTVISSDNNHGLRPAIARDNTTDQRLAVWIDQNDTFHNLLVASLIDAHGQVADPVVISDNIGGIVTAPEAPFVSADSGLFKTVWTGEGNNGDDVFFAVSVNGSQWSESVNVSQTAASSLQPSVISYDVNSDGAADAVVIWREDDGLTSRVYATVLINNEDSFEAGGDPVPVSVNTADTFAYDPCMAAGEESIAFVWAENGDIYLKEYAYDEQTLNLISETVNISQTPDIRDAHPSAVYIKDDDTGVPAWAVAWEQSTVHGEWRQQIRSDVMFARLDLSDNSANPASPSPLSYNVNHRQNLTHSLRHSQKPVLAKDDDNNLALAWVEQGYEDDELNRDDLYQSAVFLARSFNDGAEFHRPYLELQKFDDSTRLGHINLTADRDALISLVWQTDTAGQKSVCFTTTEGLAQAPENHVVNDTAGETVSYMLMDRNGPWSLADNDARLLRTLPLDGLNTMPNVPNGQYFDYSPSGRYLAAAGADGWVLEAEADGAHPIGIYSPANPESDFHITEIYWSPEEDVIGANFIDWGFVIFERSGIREWRYETDLFSAGSASFNNPWAGDKAVTFIDYSIRTESIINIFENVFDPESRKIRELWLDLGEIGESSPVLSPDGAKIAFLSHEDTESYDQGKGRLYTVLSTGGTPVRLSTDFTVSSPSWSPDSATIAFVNHESSGKYVMIAYPYRQPSAEPVKLTTAISDAEIVIFSDSGEELFVQRENGRFSRINLETKTVQELPGLPRSLAKINRPAGMLQISPGDFTITEGTAETTEIKLARPPTAPVTVTIHDDVQHGVSVTPGSLTFDETNWDVSQEIQIEAVDDDIYLGTRERLITFSINSVDPRYDNYINRGIYVIIIDDDPDPDDPSYPRWTNATLQATRTGASWVELTWSGASDETGVVGYRVYKEGLFIKGVAGEKAIITGLEKDSEVTFKVEAVNHNEKESNTGPALTLQTMDEEQFYAGVGYDSGGMQAGGGQPVAHGWTRQSTYAGPEGSGLLWYHPHTMRYVSDPVIGNDGTIYYTGYPDLPGSSEWYVYAVHSDGNLKWKRTLEDGIYSIHMEGMQPAPHLTHNDEVIVAGKHKVFCLDTADGETVWSFELQKEPGDDEWLSRPVIIPTSPVMTADGTVLFSAAFEQHDLMLYALNDDGEQVWRYESGIYSGGGAHGSLGSAYTTPVPLENGLILFGQEMVGLLPNGTPYRQSMFEPAGVSSLRTTHVMGPDGHVYIARAGDPGGLYRVVMSGGEIEETVFHAEFAVSGRGLALDFDGNAYVGGEDGDLLYAIDSAGNVEWIYEGDGKVVGAPLVDIEGNIYFTADNHKMYSLDKEGTLNWVFDIAPEDRGWILPGMPALGGNNTLCFTTTEGLYVIGMDKDGEIGFADNSYSAVRDDSYATVTLTRSGDARGAAIVYIGVEEESTALEGTDYERLSPDETAAAVVVFTDGETEINHDIALINNELFDGNKKLILSIIKVVGGEEAGNNAVTEIDLRDHRTYDHVSIEHEDYSVPEDAGEIDINVLRVFGGPDEPEQISVDYNTLDLTALGVVDYLTKTGELIFAPDEKVKTITITIIDNDTYQGNRDFALIIDCKVPGVEIVTDYSEILIIDDETAPVIGFELTEQTVREDDGTITIQIERTGCLSGTSSVLVQLNNVLSSAENNVHFDKFSGALLEFGAGETTRSFNIDIIDNSVQGTSVLLVLDLVSPEDAVIDPGKFRMEITIFNKTAFVPAPTAEAGLEGGYGHILVTNILAPAYIRLYSSDGTVLMAEVAPLSERRFNSVPFGTGYYVTQEVNGIESPPSNTVDVVEPPPKVGSVNATWHLEPGTNEGTTKLIITDMNPARAYFIAITWDYIEEPEEGATMGNVKGSSQWTTITVETMDNIPASMGQDVCLIEAEGDDDQNEVIGFNRRMIEFHEIKNPD